MTSKEAHKRKPRVGQRGGTIKISILHFKKNNPDLQKTQPRVFVIPADASPEDMVRVAHALIDALNARFGGRNG